jgi:RNA polymerase sigma-70 factor (ECF subfamily)
MQISRSSSSARAFGGLMGVGLSLKQASSRPVFTVPEDCSDVELVQRIRAGQVAAEAALYHRLAPGMLQVVTRLLGSREEAQDALHDTFVVGLQQLKQLRAPPAVRAWMMRIAVSLVHRRMRRRQLLRRLGFAAPGEQTGLLCLQANASAPPDVRAELALLDHALAGLPTAQRIAWMLRYVEGHSLPEVAELCGCSLATAKRRIAAAHQTVQAHVRFQEAPGGGP